MTYNLEQREYVQLIALDRAKKCKQSRLIGGSYSLSEVIGTVLCCSESAVIQIN